jgi:hypothetical protein
LASSDPGSPDGAGLPQRSLALPPRPSLVVSQAVSAASSPHNLIGRHVEVRGDRHLVKVYFAGQLISCDPRTKGGGRVTNPADLPSERTDYAMRDIASQKAKAHRRS